jgi:hypothetical protein
VHEDQRDRRDPADTDATAVRPADPAATLLGTESRGAADEDQNPGEPLDDTAIVDRDNGVDARR